MKNYLLNRIYDDLSKQQNLKVEMSEKEILVKSNTKTIFRINSVGCIKTIGQENQSMFYIIYDVISKIRAEIQSEKYDICK
ncbi:MAG: hypothetical protein IJE62_08620 [Clostridia bacterium]|nr:hypothetical protein [Clostridia bacterium]